jgi:integrase
MALEISIYNRQKQTSKNGKEYTGYVVAFEPGQRGSIPAAAEVPPFYVRDQRGGQQWIRLEARTLADAKIEAQKAQSVITAKAAGVDVASTPDGDTDRLTSRIDEYLLEVESNKAHATWLSYNRSLELFRESCSRLKVQDVRREDLLAFKNDLRRKDFKVSVVRNHFLNVSIFFKWAGRPLTEMKITKYDWPKDSVREPEEYHTEEIEALLTAADKDERLLLNAFLNTGLRNSEMAWLTYDDIDARNSLWSVRPKPNHPLKNEQSQRIVPVGEWLTKKIMDRKTANNRSDSDLIFPGESGGVNRHLLRVVKAVAKRAKVGGRVDNHKFRSTAITIWLRDGRTVPEVMKYVGHKNPMTILHYAAKMNLSKRENRQMVTKAFDRFSSVGD